MSIPFEPIGGSLKCAKIDIRFDVWDEVCDIHESSVLFHGQWVLIWVDEAIDEHQSNPGLPHPLFDLLTEAQKQGYQLLLGS